MKDPIKKACKVLGSQAELARALNVSPPTIHEWISGKRPVPIERCPQIEKVTRGEVTRKDLRPADWYLIWPELAEPKAKCRPCSGDE